MLRFLIFSTLFVCSQVMYAFSPAMLTGSMDKTFYSQKGVVFRVVYTSFDVTKYAQVMNVKVPSGFRLNDLQIWVTTSNLTSKELSLAQTRIPFSLSASPITLVLQGKNKTVKFKADEAILTPINTILLRDNVRLISNKSVGVGDKASLVLDADRLIFSFDTGKIAFKF